jgi:hypothetical protein
MYLVHTLSIPRPYLLIPSIPSVGKKVGSKGAIEVVVEMAVGACAVFGWKRIME